MGRFRMGGLEVASLVGSIRYGFGIKVQGLRAQGLKP